MEPLRDGTELRVESSSDDEHGHLQLSDPVPQRGLRSGAVVA
jgi:hypothetical protein